MPKFVFPFESLKKYRANKLLLAKKEMFAAESKIRDLVARFNLASENRRQLITDKNTESHVGKMSLYTDLVESETVKMRILDGEILTAHKEFDRHKNWVTHLGRELRIVERLEEKKHGQFKDEQNMKEKRVMNGWVAERWAHQMSTHLSHKNEDST